MWAAAFDANGVEEIVRALTGAGVLRVVVCSEEELSRGVIVPPGAIDRVQDLAAAAANNRLLTHATVNGRDRGRENAQSIQRYMLTAACSVACFIAGQQLGRAASQASAQRFLEATRSAAQIAHQRHARVTTLVEERRRMEAFSNSWSPRVLVVAEVVARLDSLSMLSWLELRGDSVDFEVRSEAAAEIPRRFATSTLLRRMRLVGGITREDAGDGPERALFRAAVQQPSRGP